MRMLIADIVRSIQPHDALEQAHLAATSAWIDSGADLFRRAKPATPPQHLVSYAVLVDPHAQQLLLAEHRNAGLWLPTGGHVEPDEHPATSARRELSEELQLSAPLLFEQPLFLTVTDTVGSTAGHTDVSLWYVFHGDRHSQLQADQAEFQQISWFSFDQLPLPRVDPHLQRFTAKLRAAQEALAAPGHG